MMSGGKENTDDVSNTMNADDGNTGGEILPSHGLSTSGGTSAIAADGESAVPAAHQHDDRSEHTQAPGAPPLPGDAPHAVSSVAIAKEAATTGAVVSPGQKKYRTYDVSLFDLRDNEKYKWTVPPQMGREVAQALIGTKNLSEYKIRRLFGMNKRTQSNTDLGECPVLMDLDGWVPNPDQVERLRQLHIFIEKSLAGNVFLKMSLGVKTKTQDKDMLKT